DGAQIAFDGNAADPSWAFVAIYTMKANGTNVALFADSAQDPAWMPAKVPVATFKFACSGLTCSFDGSASHDSDGTITNYAWDFGDGTTPAGATTAGPTVGHMYAAAGTYIVKLTVTDNGGATGIQSKAVTVTVPNIPPVASFTFSCNQL